jgi:hypothetical protein
MMSSPTPPSKRDELRCSRIGKIDTPNITWPLTVLVWHRHFYKKWWGVCLFVCVMVSNAPFNNISVTSWRLFLLLEESRGRGENHRPVASDWNFVSHNVVHLALIEIRAHNTCGVNPTTIRSRPRRPLWWGVTLRNNWLYNSIFSIHKWIIIVSRSANCLFKMLCSDIDSAQ